jgi:hypothetical protein
MDCPIHGRPTNTSNISRNCGAGLGSDIQGMPLARDAQNSAAAFETDLKKTRSYISNDRCPD